MFLLSDTSDQTYRFCTMVELKEYIEIRHAEKGGFDWICEIKDDKGNSYGCSWHLYVTKT